MFKLKRAVRFPYLDYGTAELRRRFCEAELTINRRTAGDLYRRVLPVVRQADGNLALDGEGEPVDWLIEMQRFADDALFDRLAEAGRLDRFAMESLADGIAHFHADAERRFGAGGAAAMAHILDGNMRSFGDADATALDPSRLRELAGATRQAVTALAPLLDRRRSEGFVRHCHGDLHLGNIVACEGRAVLFDAIEFDATLADIDVLYDLAFLVMDLEFRELRRLGSILLNRYLDVTGDSGGLAALPLFLSMRAAIRSHVNAAAAAAHLTPKSQPLSRMMLRDTSIWRFLPSAGGSEVNRRRRSVGFGQIAAGAGTGAAFLSAARRTCRPHRRHP